MNEKRKNIRFDPNDSTWNIPLTFQSAGGYVINIQGYDLAGNAMGGKTASIRITYAP